MNQSFKGIDEAMGTYDLLYGMGGMRVLILLFSELEQECDG
jgi:hypothetical protein